MKLIARGKFLDLYLSSLSKDEFVEFEKRAFKMADKFTLSQHKRSKR